jgi:hypothetical protein
MSWKTRRALDVAERYHPMLTSNKHCSGNTGNIPAL